jgi:hypothetical protein
MTQMGLFKNGVPETILEEEFFWLTHINPA